MAKKYPRNCQVRTIIIRNNIGSNNIMEDKKWLDTMVGQ